MSAKPQNVQLGYKRTDIGHIPIDWNSSALGPLVTITSGESPSLFRFGFSGVPYFKVEQLNNCSKYLGREETEYFISPPPKTVPAGSVLFPKRGASIMLNKVRLLKADGYMDTNMMALTPREDLDSEYLYYTLCHMGLASVADVTSIPQINNKHISPFAVPCPVLAEQRAIAEALSDVDGLIGALEALIAKKRAIKQAAMQQLLTGKTRLLGFTGKWGAKRLGELGVFLKGSGVRKDEAQSGDLPCIRYGEIYTRHNDYIKSFNSWISPTVAASATQLKKGDLLFAGSGETKEDIGKCVAFIGEHEAFAGGDIVILRARDVDPIFMGYYCNIGKINAQKSSKGQGDAVVHISASALATIEIKVPSLGEQTAIATVLSDMDAEIETLLRRHDKTTQIKQGMMQQLLTGRIRLVKPGVATGEKAKAQTGARQANVHFMRSVLAAEIIDQLHDQPTFGHVKFEKMMFLVEHLCEVETGSTYHRKAAGPYDNRALRSIDSQLRAQQWFDARKEGKRYQYVPMQKRGGHKRYFDRYFSGIEEPFDRILGAFKTLDTERCEIVATLFAAWSDLLRDRETVSDQLIVHEVLNNWHEAKRRISEDRWLKALGWMRSQSFVPKGAT